MPSAKTERKMAEILQLANAKARPSRMRSYIETPTALDMQRSLDLVRAMPEAAITMISGAPGVGKTSVLTAFCADEGHDALLLPVARGEGTPPSIARNILSMFRIKANGLALDQMRELVEQYIGRGRALVIDEAQYVSRDGLEWLRSTSEAGGFDLIFAGDLSLNGTATMLPQFYRRIVRPVVIEGACRGDIEALLEGGPFDRNDLAIDTLLLAARTRDGNLGNVANALRHAKLLAGADAMTLAHLKAAVVDLKLAPKGRRT
jgi:hypothetical protein